MILYRILRYIYKYYISLKKFGGFPAANNSNYDDLLKEYSVFCDAHREIKYEVSVNEKNLARGERLFVGGAWFNGSFVLTPNKEKRVLCVNAEKWTYIGDLPEDDYKWTGETVYKNKIYFLPRKASSLLVLDGEELSELEGYQYKNEHHYGGVRWKNLVIQPPRSTDHFLIWDLDNMECRRLRIGPNVLSKFFRYNCSIIHPNGYAYFFPENGRVIKLDINTLDFCFVGKWINTMIFDAKVLPDGNIYGFSTNNTGIIKFNVIKDEIEVLYKEKSIKSYGTKLGINGKIYSVPGSGRCVWEYDYRSNDLNVLVDLEDEGYAKYAGGCTTPNGEICMAPSFADKLLTIIPRETVKIPIKLYEAFWVDCY